MGACGPLWGSSSPLGIEQPCTSDNHSKGSADSERVMRTLKAECLWLHEWTCLFELSRGLDAWIAYDNEHSLPLIPGLQNT
jgi:hypothetical protein